MNNARQARIRASLGEEAPMRAFANTHTNGNRGLPPTPAVILGPD